MRVNTIKSVFTIILLVISAICFIYVNTAANVNDHSVAQPNLKVENKVVQDTRMPDLKLVKSVIDVVGKFITAK